TIGGLASAGNALAKSAHDEKTLRQGWKKTLSALNNPRNRRAGLDALYHNTTLTIHAIAWAALDKDPIALQIMRTCDVNAQTLADSGSDQEAVVTYLEAMFAEDPQFKDPDKVKSDWVPSPLPLTFAGWFTVKSRAQRKAVPKLNAAATSEIDAAF